MSTFTDNENIKEILEKIPKGKQYSDVMDAEGNQYVDLVQEGGGTLGIALVGYTYVMEKAGIRFFSLAGTSAGAINTMLMAGLGNIHEPKSEKILEILGQTNLFDFVDGDKVVKKAIDKVVKKEGGLFWYFVWHGIKIYKILKKKLGLNPGDEFEGWITKLLKDSGIGTLKDLKQLRSELPKGLKNIITNESMADAIAKLAIITSDITTHTKTDFPRMAELYWENPESVSPAKLVRSSMSIPFFFEPFEVKNIPNAGTIDDPKWDEFAGYNGPVPSEVKFVDGGMISNFPINVFHRDDGKPPTRPTFGARLSTYRANFSNTDKILSMSGAMISTMRQIYDYDFLLKNPDYSRLICSIDADGQFNWLDFNMSQEDRVKLFNLGASKAVQFLNDFSWDEYKAIRSPSSDIK
jgi:NTE family protein